MTRLNLGSGQNLLPQAEGWVNCDIEPECAPDVLMDMEQDCWPFEDGSVDEARLYHVLEHIGEGYSTLWKELYRVLKPGGTVEVVVPHPRHEHFIGDPTHVRPVHQLQFTLLSRKNCAEWKEQGYANSPLALYWGVDFDVQEITLVPDKRWAAIRSPAQQTVRQLAEDAEMFLGVCREIRVVLVRGGNGAPHA